MISSEYIAGLFDGEGCIHVSKQETGVHYKVSIHQKHLPFITYLRETLGFGKVRLMNAAWAVQFENKADIIRFLVPIIPFLILRKAEAEIMVQLCSINRKKGRPVEVDFTKEEQEQLISDLRAAFDKRKAGV